MGDRPYETRSEQRAFDGVQGFYTHESAACAGPMRVGVYLPPGAVGRGERVPAVYFLAGLSCTEETFALKAGAARLAAQLGLALVTPDTSPRGHRFPGDDAHWDFGLGASFYLDATEAPWREAYRMERYIVDELPRWVEAHFPVSGRRRGVMGHSMGGHGALTLALRNPGRYASLSAFAPIVAPSEVPWGQKAFAGYLGPKGPAWEAHDATALVQRAPFAGEVLIDQGLDDRFLGRELRPERFEAACTASGQRLTLRTHPGYDHSYFFVATFVDDHLRHHARALCG